jgi:hypothetical protein
MLPVEEPKRNWPCLLQRWGEQERDGRWGKDLKRKAADSLRLRQRPSGHRQVGPTEENIRTFTKFKIRTKSNFLNLKTFTKFSRETKWRFAFAHGKFGTNLSKFRKICT